MGTSWTEAGAAGAAGALLVLLVLRLLLVLVLVVVLLVLTRLLQGVGRTPGNVVALPYPELGLLLHAGPTNLPVVN